MLEWILASGREDDGGGFGNGRGLFRPYFRSVGKFGPNGLEAQRKADIVAALPQLELVKEGGAVEPAILAAEQSEVIGVGIGQIGDVPRLRAEAGEVALGRIAVGGFHHRRRAATSSERRRASLQAAASVAGRNPTTTPSVQ